MDPKQLLLEATSKLKKKNHPGFLDGDHKIMRK